MHGTVVDFVLSHIIAYVYFGDTVMVQVEEVHVSLVTLAFARVDGSLSTSLLA